MTTEILIADYSNKSGAARRARGLGIANPVFKTREDGRVELYKVEQTLLLKPVERFRAIFAENFGKLRYSEIIALAVTFGISENTAKTYYYKLKNA